jgi:hypothetical protein
VINQKEGSMSSILLSLGLIVMVAFIILFLGELLYFVKGSIAVLRNDLDKAGRNVPLFSKLVLYNLIVMMVAFVFVANPGRVSVYGWTVSYRLLLVLGLIPRILPYYFLWLSYKMTKEGKWEEAGQMFKIFAPPYFLTYVMNILFSAATGQIP